MTMNRLKSVHDIAKAFKVDSRAVDTAVRYAKCEGLSLEEICTAVSENVIPLSACAKKDFKDTMIAVCRDFSKGLERFKDENHVSGNSVRDRLLEVGYYSPYSPRYIDKTLKC